MSLRRGDIVYVAVKGPYTTPVKIIVAGQKLALITELSVFPER